MADVTVAMVTSASRLFEPDEAIRGKVFVFSGGLGGGEGNRAKGKVGCAANRSGKKSDG